MGDAVSDYPEVLQEPVQKGYLSKKAIGGKTYYYHQWSENGVKQSRYLHDSEIKTLTDEIETRKELQAQLRTLKSQRIKRNEGTGEMHLDA